MREIKFRGKSKETGEWVYGDLNREKYGTVIQSLPSVLPTGNGAPERKPVVVRYRTLVDPVTVGQYTGLKDCKRTEECPDGQEIYEGDIVNRLTNDAVFETGVVQWSDYLSSWLIECINTDGRLILAAPGTIKGSGEVRSYEIIGNIYENPDLIKAVRG